MEKFVITINRYCGSGGATVGRKIAEKLNINFYDKEMIDLASEENGMLTQTADRVRDSLFSRISDYEYDGNLITPESSDFAPYQDLFNYQAKIIKDLADKENCVVVGRCADFVLSEHKNLIRVFISADEQTCIQNEMKRLDITNRQAKERICKVNLYRKAYYRHHTGQSWHSVRHYDISLSTSRLSYDECADMVIEYLNKVLAKNKDE